MIGYIYDTWLGCCVSVAEQPMRDRLPRKSVDFESIDLGDSLYSYPHGTNPGNLAPYKARILFSSSSACVTL